MRFMGDSRIRIAAAISFSIICSSTTKLLVTQSDQHTCLYPFAFEVLATRPLMRFAFRDKVILQIAELQGCRWHPRQKLDNCVFAGERAWFCQIYVPTFRHQRIQLEHHCETLKLPFLPLFGLDSLIRFIFQCSIKKRIIISYKYHIAEIIITFVSI